LGLAYSTQIDVWSAGVTLFEIATGKALFNGETNNEMIHNMLKLCGSFPHSFATSGEFAKKHFNSNGDFLNAKGDFAVNSANPVQVPMTAFPNPARPVLGTLEVDLAEPRGGVDLARHRGQTQDVA